MRGRGVTSPRSTSTPTASPGATADPAASAGPTTPGTIPQPSVGDLPTHPESERVDLAMPTFNDDWATVANAVADLRSAREALPADELPRLVAPILDDSIQALAEAADGTDAAATRQAAIDVRRSSLDLQLRYRPTTEVDRARFGLWLDQVELDAAAGDVSGLRSDFFGLDYVRDRIAGSLGGNHALVNQLLEELLGTITDEDFEAAAEVATRLQQVAEGR